MGSSRIPIEVIAGFDLEGKVSPIKFRYYDKNENIVVVAIDKIVKRDINRYAGNKMLIFSCRCSKNGQISIIEVRYEVDTCRWFLYTS